MIILTLHNKQNLYVFVLLNLKHTHTQTHNKRTISSLGVFLMHEEIIIPKN